MSSIKVKNTYTIEEVSEIANVNSFTLRNWEDRYQLFTPERDANGRRIFSEIETMRAVCASELVRRDFKIGKIAAEFHEAKDPCEVLSRYLETDYFLELRHRVLETLLEFNPGPAQSAFDYLIANFTIEFLADHFFYPLFRELEELKIAEKATQFQLSFAHHQLASRLHRLLGFVEMNTKRKLDKKVIVTGLPGNEYEDSLLILYLTLQRYGWDVIYAGKEVPPSDFLPVIEKVAPKGIITVGNNISEAHYHAIEPVLASLPTPVILGGKLAHRLKENELSPPANVEWSTFRPGPLARLMNFKLL